MAETGSTLTLSGTGALPADATIEVMDGTGAMVYRSSVGSGDIVYDDVQLLWDYTADGISVSDAIELKVFAMEMVFIPEGAFFVGDGRSDLNQFYEGGTANLPFQITSEGAIAVSNSSGNLYYSDTDSSPGDLQGPIPAGFPKGYSAFYCQKYETSQQEWVDFFNTLPTAVRGSFDLTDASAYNGSRNSNANKTNNRVTPYDGAGGDISTTYPDIPVNFVDQVQALAYLDWAGLRPFTELEFEKVGRGTNTPVDGEYAHGTNSAEAIVPSVTNKGATDSRISNFSAGEGHFIFGIPRDNGANGPLRCGITAASAANFTRLETGGSFYGVMELSGNLWERIVTVGTPAGRSFIGQHGDGTLSTDGSHNVSGWPAGSEEAFGIKGCAYVSGGGSNANRILRCSVSARRNAAGNRNRGDHDYALFRGVRSL
jgi:formylglycine-generating enzyme required for sulfatase activity